MIRTLVTACLLATGVGLLHAQDEDVLRPKGRPEGSRRNSVTRSSMEDKFRLGLEVGGTFGFMNQSMDRTNPLPDSPENVLASGSGLSPFVNILADLPLTNSMGIRFRLGWDQRRLSNTKAGISDGVLEDGSTVVDVKTTSSYKMVTNNIDAGVLFRIDVAPKIYIAAGPVALFTLGDIEREDTWTWNGPDGTAILVDYALQPGQYSSISRTVSRNTNFLPNADLFSSDPNVVNAAAKPWNTTQVGFELGVGYETEIAKGIFLSPHLRFQYYFTKMSDKFTAEDLSRVPTQRFSTITFGGGNMAAVQLGVGLLFDL